MIGGTGKVSDGSADLDAEFWAEANPQDRLQAVWQLRALFYEVLNPGTGSKRLDRTVGGTRRRQD